MENIAPDIDKARKGLQRLLSGKSLSKLLKERGITRYKLAKETGISYRTLQYWEEGRNPSIILALKVGKYFGLTEEVDKEELKRQLDELNERCKRYGI